MHVEPNHKPWKNLNTKAKTITFMYLYVIEDWSKSFAEETMTLKIWGRIWHDLGMMLGRLGNLFGTVFENKLNGFDCVYMLLNDVLFDCARNVFFCTMPLNVQRRTILCLTRSTG